MPALEVTTVLGPIAPEAMGITQPHEHLLVDLFDMSGTYDGILEDAGLAAEELAAFARRGRPDDRRDDRDRHRSRPGAASPRSPARRASTS